MHTSQEDFFKMIIHDLKGPLGEIMANLDLLSYEKSLSGPNKEYLETAVIGCENLFQIVLNIIDTSKMEEGRMILNKSAFRIEDIIEESVRRVKTIGKQNENHFVIDLKGDIKELIADQNIIERVLSNLLLNAISYSFPKTEIKVIAEPGDKYLLKISIVDQGRGIPEEFQDKIFDKYHQATKNGVPHKNSSGLGLTFCKMAIEAHNGRIWVESREGKGSSFHFTIPMPNNKPVK